MRAFAYVESNRKPNSACECIVDCFIADEKANSKKETRRRRPDTLV